MGDDVDDMDILIAIVGSQLAYIMELQDRNVELNDELNEASKMLEMVNELLAVVSNRVEDNVAECKKIKLLVLFKACILVAKSPLFILKFLLWCYVL